ncbi:MAG: lysophospholipid acyltransferase family protein [Cyclobacteriaceae bacterium]
MKLLYYIVLVPLSRLPSSVLYGISDFLYVVIYRLAGYRKRVVRTNIRNSFPEKSRADQLKIERKFYVHFCDLIVESIKAFSISEEELAVRFVHRNPKIFESYFDQGKTVTLVGGHYCNWELFAVSVALHIAHKPVALFTPLSNKFMNAKITESRSKYGLWMKNYAEIKEMASNGLEKPVTVIFAADQCPRISQQPHWVQFLNQETGVQFGTEKFARDFNTPVIYGVIHKTKRGHYEVEYRLVCENPHEIPLGRITEIHTSFLESDIINEPAFWLWTHKRWKRSRRDFEEYALKENELAVTE